MIYIVRFGHAIGLRSHKIASVATNGLTAMYIFANGDWHTGGIEECKACSRIVTLKRLENSSLENAVFARDADGLLQTLLNYEGCDLEFIKEDIQVRIGYSLHILNFCSLS